MEGPTRPSSACAANRKLAEAAVLDPLPVHYSTLPALIRAGRVRVDVLMLQVSLPDAAGRHSLGLACEYLGAALESRDVSPGSASPTH